MVDINRRTISKFSEMLKKLGSYVKREWHWNMYNIIYEMKKKSSGNESENRSVMSNSLWPHSLYNPWNSPGQSTRVGSLSLLQGILQTQGSNPSLPHCRQIFLPAEPQGKPKNTGVGSLKKKKKMTVKAIKSTVLLGWGIGKNRAKC